MDGLSNHSEAVNYLAQRAGVIRPGERLALNHFKFIEKIATGCTDFNEAVAQIRDAYFLETQQATVQPAFIPSYHLSI